MIRAHLRRMSVVAIAITLHSPLAYSPPPAACTIQPKLTPEEIRAAMLGAVEHLWIGTPETKRQVVENSYALRRGLEASALVIPPREAEEVVESLRTFLRIELDDWITSRLLESLSTSSSNYLAPLFRDALDSPSVNVRRQAIQRFIYREDPEARKSLEDAWLFEERPWILADLIEALANHDSDAHLQDFLRLTQSENHSVALAAIEALGDLGDPLALPILITNARGGAREYRLRSLEALTSWPDSVDALQVILESSRSEDEAVRNRATESLGSFDDPSAIERLIEIVRDRDAGFGRVIAMEAFGETPHPEVAPVLVEVLREMPRDDDPDLHAAALRALYNRDDPKALPGLRSLDSGVGSDGHLTTAKLIAYLSRERSSEDRDRIQVFRTYCTFGCPSRPMIQTRCASFHRAAWDPSVAGRFPGSPATPKSICGSLPDIWH